MIFLDTSGIFALADRNDAKHDEALQLLEKVQSSGQRLLTHNYVLVESAALLQRRLGLKSALAFLDEADEFVVRWITPEIHSDAVSLLKKNNKNKLSLVDTISFVVMRRENVAEYFGFDEHFASEGFRSFSV